MSGIARSARCVLVYPWIGCGDCRVCRDGHENLCMKPRCLGVHCDGGYSDQTRRPAFEISAAARRARSRRGRALRLLGRHDLFRAEETRRRHQGRAGAGDRRRRPRADVRDASSKRWAARARSSSTSTQTRRDAALEAGALAAVDGGAPGCAGAGRRPRSAARAGRRSIWSAALQTAALGLRRARQGRQAGHGRSVRRRRAVVAAADPDESGHHRGQLHRQPRRARRTSRTCCGPAPIPPIPIDARPLARGDRDARRFEGGPRSSAASC